MRAIDDEVPAAAPGEPWTVSVYGADQPGIVHRMTTLLADAGVNIADLTTRVIGDPDRPVYAMVGHTAARRGAACRWPRSGGSFAQADRRRDCHARPHSASVPGRSDKHYSDH